MRKLLVGLAVVALVACLASPVLAQAAAKDPAAAGLLSAVVPGAGEWYNNSWNGSFPWGECVVGHICPCFMLSSVFDAVNGDATTNLRFDFWTAPGSK